MNGGTVTYTANEFRSILLGANRVIDRGAEQLDGIWVPYMDFLFSELPIFTGANTEEAEAVLKQVTEQDPKTAGGMINPKKPAKLLFTDQHGVISSVEFQASDIAELLKKAAYID